jgi:hypothetical protein
MERTTHIQKHNAMRTITTFPTMKTICAMIALALGLLVVTKANAQPQSDLLAPVITKADLLASINEEWEAKIQKDLEEVAKWVQPLPVKNTSYKIVDDKGHLLFESEESDYVLVSNPELKKWLKHSELVVEYGGTRYYLYHQCKSQGMIISKLDK